MDIENPFRDVNVPESQGVRYQRLAGEAAMLAEIIGLHLTPRGKTALAILIQEGEDWWRTNNNAKSISSILALLKTVINNH